MVHVQFHGIVAVGRPVVGIHPEFSRVSEVNGVGTLVIAQGVAVHILDKQQARVLGAYGADDMGRVGVQGQRVGIIDFPLQLVDGENIAAACVGFLIHAVQRVTVFINLCQGFGGKIPVHRSQRERCDGGVAIICDVVIIIVIQARSGQHECRE